MIREHDNGNRLVIDERPDPTIPCKEARTRLALIQCAVHEQAVDWMHFHEVAMAEPFKAEQLALRFCDRIAAIAAGRVAALVQKEPND